MNKNRYLLLGTLAFSCLAVAQDSNGGWRRLGESNPYPASSGAPASAPSPAPAPAPQPPQPSLPSTLTIKPGTYITVRLNQALSSDRNQPGDAFAATLVKPVVVDGVVVAERGQTVGGRVAESQKAGHISGVSRLGVQLIDLPVVTGEQVPIQTQLVSRTGPTSVGQDAGAIAGTTAFGAAVGAAAAWGTGAAIGAGAGAAAGLIGVLVTRGHPTIIPPESVLTFRIDQPVTISTERAPYAFRPVEPADYQQSSAPRLQTRAPAGPGYPSYGPPPPYPYPYGGFYGPYPFYGGFFYGPRVVVGFRGYRW